MGNFILKHDEAILHCSNWAMEMFYENLKHVINSQGLSDNERLAHFLDKLNQDDYGRGCIYIELTDYFNNDSDKLPPKLFYDLTVKVIDRTEQANLGEFQEGYFLRLNEFKNKILY